MITTNYLFLFVFCLLFIRATLELIKFTLTKRKLAPIPGPKGRWLLGGNLDLFYGQGKKLSPNAFYNILKGLAKVYAEDGIFKLRFGNKFIVCVFKPNLVKNLFTSKVNIDKSVEYAYLGDWLGPNGLLLASKQTGWFTRHRLLAKAFHRDVLEHYFSGSSSLNKKVDQFISEKMRCSLTGYLLPDETFKFTIETIAESLLQSRIPSTDAYWKAMHRMTDCFTKRALNPFLWNEMIFRWSTVGQVFTRNLAQLKSISERVVLEKVGEMKFNKTSSEGTLTKKPIHGLLDLLLPDNTTQSRPTLEEIKTIANELDTFLFAGPDTTGLVLNWALYRLGAHPQVQTALREEAEKVLVEFELKDNKNLPVLNRTQLDKLPLLESFLLETLRLHAPVPLVGRNITEELVLGEGFREKFTVPNGTQLYVLIDELNERYFGLSAGTFDPTRFLGSKKNSSTSPKLFSFSAGLRSCIGKRFAILLLKLVLAKVLLRYQVEPSSQKLEEIPLEYDIVQRPSVELRIRLTDRL